MVRRDVSHPNSPLYAIGVAILSTVAILPLAKMLGLLGIDGGTPISQLLITVVLLWLYPESGNRAWSFSLVAALMLAGLLMGAFWAIAAAMTDSAVFPTPGQFPLTAIWLGFLNSVIAAPLYEEKVVRHLLLDGISSLTNFLVGTLVVSVLFALVHSKSMIWTFIVSVVLCWMAAKFGLNTYQRAIVHGAINLVIMSWYFTRGFEGFLV